MVRQGGVETRNDFNPQGAIFGGPRANYSVVWELNVFGAFVHREVSVTLGKLVENER